METPLISVIVPVYKVEKYLDKCVQSIVDQTYKNLEIILVDDGSPDNCPQMCDEWAKKDPRIKVIHKENGGASSARNVGIDIAQGDYLGFVDSDDFIDLRMYEKLFNAVRNSTKKISHCFSYRYKADRVIELKHHRASKEYDLEAALNEVFLGRVDYAVWSKLFEKGVFEGVRFPINETNEEAPVIIPVLARSQGFVCVAAPLYYYRETEGSVTSSLWRTDCSVVLKHLKEMYEQLQGIKLEDIKSFRVFAGKSAYGTALKLDKFYCNINDRAKENQIKYIMVMKKVLFSILFTTHMRMKDKILYLMVVTRTLRPIYKVLGKK